MKTLKMIFITLLLSGCGRTRVTHSYSFSTLNVVFVVCVAIGLFAAWWIIKKIPK